MFKKVFWISVFGIFGLMVGCTQTPTSSPTPTATRNPNCATYTGFGRYTMTVHCEEVILDGNPYMLERLGGGPLIIEGHTISRGVYRKTQPWLYVHDIGSDSIDVTFDEGLRVESVIPNHDLPLYTGSTDPNDISNDPDHKYIPKADVFNPHGWEITLSTDIEFSNGTWLISHKWSNEGIYFDLQKESDRVFASNDPIFGTLFEWDLLSGDIFVPGNETVVHIGEISTDVKILEFDPTDHKARVIFAYD
jgi:hypothetical protein